MMRAPSPHPTVPRLWPESTIVCVGSGPSLTQADVDSCRGKTRVIVVNDAYRLALWADCLYACDAKFWRWHKGVPGFAGLKFALAPQSCRWPNVQVLQNTGQIGLELTPTGLRTGHNSGYQAINLAVHFGARRIVLLGYDMKGDHFFGSHPDQTRPPFSVCLKKFETLLAPLAAAGVTVVNATRRTVLSTFPCMPLESALAERAA
jgi:hypothetical protein